MATYDLVHVIVRREDDWLVAQCLEIDIATQAKTIPDLLYQLQSTLVGHFLAAQKEGLSLEDIPAAPQEYWEQWGHSAAVTGETEPLPWIPAAVLRRAELRFA